MSPGYIFSVIAGMTLVTYLPRFLPAWFLASRTLPESLTIWLKYVPISVFAAILLPGLLLQQGQLMFNVHNVYLWSALPTLWVAYRMRHFLMTILSGMFFTAVARWFVIGF